jgi:hypothetical protein
MTALDPAEYLGGDPKSMLGNFLLGSAVIILALTTAFAIHSIIQTRSHSYDDYIQRKRQFGRFLEFTFLGKLEKMPGRTANVASFTRNKTQDGLIQQNQAGNLDALFVKRKIIFLLNWAFGIILLACLIAMLIYAQIYKSESVPTYISSAFSMILGWFGHAYISFLVLDKRR